jgi:transposase
MHSAEEPQFHYPEDREADRYLTQGTDPVRLLKVARRVRHREAYPRPENYDMDVDPQREEVLSQSTYPLPADLP